MHDALIWLRQDHVACDLVVIKGFLAAGHALDLLRPMRRCLPDSRVVVWTEHATADLRHRCHQLGADRVFDSGSELDALLAYGAGLAGTGGPGPQIARLPAG